MFSDGMDFIFPHAVISSLCVLGYNPHSNCIHVCSCTQYYYCSMTIPGSYINWFDKIDAITEVEAIGQVLYTEYRLISVQNPYRKTRVS